MSTPQPSFSGPSFAGYASEGDGLRRAGFWPRVGARVIDMLMHIFIGVIFGLVVGIIAVFAAVAMGAPATQFTSRLAGGTGISGFVLSLLGVASYHTICEGMHGSSLGKRLVGITVLKEDASDCTLGAAFIRSLAFFVDSLFFGVIGYLAMKRSGVQQRYGDTWAHTIVVYRKSMPPERLPGDRKLVLILLLGVVIDGVLISLALLLKVTGGPDVTG